MQEKYLPANNIASSYADFIQSLSEDQFQYLLENIPHEISDKEPVEFNEYNKISVMLLKEIIDHEKN